MCTYSSMDGVLYCKTHFEQLFKESGNFSKNFSKRNIFWPNFVLWILIITLIQPWIELQVHMNHFLLFTLMKLCCFLDSKCCSKVCWQTNRHSMFPILSWHTLYQLILLPYTFLGMIMYSCVLYLTCKLYHDQ